MLRGPTLVSLGAARAATVLHLLLAASTGLDLADRAVVRDANLPLQAMGAKVGGERRSEAGRLGKWRRRRKAREKLWEPKKYFGGSYPFFFFFSAERNLVGGKSNHVTHVIDKPAQKVETV